MRLKRAPPARREKELLALHSAGVVSFMEEGEAPAPGGRVRGAQLVQASTGR